MPTDGTKSTSKTCQVILWSLILKCIETINDAMLNKYLNLNCLNDPATSHMLCLRHACFLVSEMKAASVLQILAQGGG